MTLKTFKEACINTRGLRETRSVSFSCIPIQRWLCLRWLLSCPLRDAGTATHGRSVAAFGKGDKAFLGFRVKGWPMEGTV